MLADVSEPVPGPNDVLVGVKACGINFPDGLLIPNKYQVRSPRPFALGSEISGVVAQVGAAVTRLGWGGLAERVAVSEDRCIAIDAEMPFDQGPPSSSPVAPRITRWLTAGMLRKASLGASGGVGIVAVQTARALGDRVIAAAPNVVWSTHHQRR